MPQKFDEERLTAYALGESEPEEARRIEAALAGDEALRQQVEQHRETAALLTAALKAEPNAKLDSQRRIALAERMQAASADPKPAAARKAAPWLNPAWLAAAASVVVSLLAAGMWATTQKRAGLSVAKAEPPALELCPSGGASRIESEKEERFKQKLADQKDCPPVSVLKSAPEKPPAAPASGIASGAVIPLDARQQPAQNGRWETVNPSDSVAIGTSESPDMSRFHEVGESKETAGGGGTGGAHIDDAIGAAGSASPGSGGGWGGGIGAGVSVGTRDGESNRENIFKLEKAIPAKKDLSAKRPQPSVVDEDSNRATAERLSRKDAMPGDGFDVSGVITNEMDDKLREMSIRKRLDSNFPTDEKKNSGKPPAAMPSKPELDPGKTSILPLTRLAPMAEREETKKEKQGHEFVLGSSETARSRFETELSGERPVVTGFLSPRAEPLSTFSIDVDSASYTYLRKHLLSDQLPQPGSVRIEEMLNYFSYEYPAPEGDAAFAALVEVAQCPWTPGNRLARIGIKAHEVAWENRPASNLVFLLDVSGSMSDANKLPLVKEAMKLLVNQLDGRDRVSIVTYADGTNVALSPTPASDKRKILSKLDSLSAGGSTNGEGGIQLAYKQAAEHFINSGTNRVILCTDGDFNVGVSDDDTLVKMIQEKAKTGVFLSVFGFGMGNVKDAKLQKLADKGNGNYGYIDDLEEARKSLVSQVGGTLLTVAKDVKVQVEFNPAQVSAYRLIGYEKRALAKEDFNNDRKDAGELGSGHTVTALYEITPNTLAAKPDVDDLKYQPPPRRFRTERDEEDSGSAEMMTVKIRYKAPGGVRSQRVEGAITDTGKSWSQSSRDFRFAAAVACFGLALRNDAAASSASCNLALELARDTTNFGPAGQRAEFLDMVKKARMLGAK